MSDEEQGSSWDEQQRVYLSLHNLPFIDIEDICEDFGCTESSVIAMLRSGELPGVKFGREWRIPRKAFWIRVNELALEQARERRQPNQSGTVAPSTDLAQGSAFPLATPRRGRPRSIY